jgi:glyoxylase-like metal-dependent hydrolase (beta-lactamase superfamily II)
MSATNRRTFLATREGVVLFDAPPTIEHNLQRAIDAVAAGNHVFNKVTHIVYSHHHADHLGASSLFGDDVLRIGQAETKALLARDNDPTRPLPDVTFENSYTLEVGGSRVNLAWLGTNHTGVLAAADVYTASTAFVLLEAIRLDLGVGSQVHA